MRGAGVVALLGAPGTGKSTLARALHDTLAAQGRRVAQVGDVLREFRDAHRRAPRQRELAGIAAEQARRIDATAATHELVIADTTALQLAVYGELMFGERSLYDAALRAQARYPCTLLCALDLPGTAGDLPRHEPMDELLRAALQRHAPGYAVVGGRGAARTAAALAALQPVAAPAPAARWQWVCERCGDADCERHLLPRG